MRFAFSAEQQMFQRSARELFDKHAIASAVRAAWADPSGRVPGLWARIADLGIAGMTVPEAFGGLGMDAIDLGLVLEEAGRAALPEPILETVAVGVPLLVEAGSDALRDAWLPRVAAGEAVVAVQDPSSPFVAFANTADLMLLMRGGELHAVRREDVALTAQPSVDGARRLFSVAWTPSARTRFALGDAARRAMAEAADRGALAAAAELVGVARRLVAMTVDYAKVRHQFGKPIGSFQAVKHHLANAHVAIEMAAPVVYRAAYSIARADPERAAHVSMAKAQASEAALLASRVALQCHGAIGYTVEYDLHLWMKRAWVLASAWGDAASHRARLGAVLFREGAL